MEALQHDPRTKQQIKTAIYDFLYEPVNRQLQKRLDNLIITNTMLGKFNHKSFAYKGITYSCDSERPPLKRNPLVPQLRPLMDSYLEDIKKLNETELPYVIGFINQVLNSSNGLTDYLRVFPESIHSPIQRLISQCPCHTQELTEDQVTELLKRNEQSIQLMKQRMTINLLLT